MEDIKIPEGYNAIVINGVIKFLKVRDGFYIPEEDERYFYPDLSTGELFGRSTWDNTTFDNMILERGIMFKTKEEALEAAKKMLNSLITE